MVPGYVRDGSVWLCSSGTITTTCGNYNIVIFVELHMAQGARGSPGYGKLPGRRDQHLMAYFTTQNRPS